MKTYIIGAASNLSRRMGEYIADSEILSVREIIAADKFFINSEEPFNLVINSFWPATELRDVRNPESFIEISIKATAKVLASLRDANVHKVFYTSSASVYGDNKNCAEADDPKPKSLHAALKLANEQLVSSYCKQTSIAYCIVRVFNLYGGDDKFSIISKIVSAQLGNEVLTIVNDGNSVRDFIHIDDVVKAYSVLLNQDVAESIINIASGNGRSVLSMLVHMRKHGYELMTNNINRDEISLSVADVSILKKYYPIESMLDPRDYIIEVLESE